ncbi:hypothetical protein ATCC90586_006677 [Pythium insidiosum]|nr:hypothetical protein ATCC90586_006677 [Pythium insidiosum]
MAVADAKSSVPQAAASAERDARVLPPTSLQPEQQQQPEQPQPEPQEPQQQEEDAPVEHVEQEQDVVLAKGPFGLGIYFTARSDGAAVVDPSVPFYRLPDDSMAPGEASGVIRAGDRLVALQGVDVQSWSFARVVEALRGTPSGDVVLRFHRSPASAEPSAGGVVLDAAPTASKPRRWSSFFERAQPKDAPRDDALLELELQLRRVERELERERKCRFLAERKNVLYRNALRALGDENAQLRYRSLRDEQRRAELQRERDALQLSI